MDKYRPLYPVIHNWAYLNHCAVSPLGLHVEEAMRRFLTSQASHGVMHESEWAQEVKETRRKAAALVNALPDEIAFVRNTVEGISIVAEGLPWQESDNVVTVNGEYPANVYPWLNLRSRGVEARVVPDRGGRVEPADLFAAVDGRTRLIALSFVEFQNGFRNDLAAVGDFCRRRNILFSVDAIQGLGALPIDVRGARTDFLTAGAHKWMLGPLGIGILYCRLPLIASLRLTQAGPAGMVPRPEYLPYDFAPRPTAQRFEPGAQNVAGIYGLGAALDLTLNLGVANIERHIWQLLDFAVDGLKTKGCEVVSSLAMKDRSCMIAFRSSKMATAELLAKLTASGVAVSARAGNIRIAPHFYNVQEDIERLLAEVPQA